MTETSSLLKECKSNLMLMCIGFEPVAVLALSA